MYSSRARHPWWCLVLSIIGVLALPTAGGTSPVDGWQAYRGALHGFTLSYPGALFAPLADDTEREGDSIALVSRDGRSRLLAEAFWNDEGETLAAYRARMLAEVYPAAALDYAPTRRTWFVVSGIKDGLMFYHRTTFACGGRLVSSWAIAYPVAERGLYDRVVEGIARRHSAGRGIDGACRPPPETAAQRDAQPMAAPARP